MPSISSRPQASRFRLPNGSSTESTAVNGLLTASLTRVLGTGDFLLSESLYDAKGRLSVTIAEHQLDGVDETAMAYNFVGEVLSVNRTHYKDNALGVTVHTANSYDHAGRIVSVSEQINGQAASVSKYHYNALGQLERNTAGGKTVTQRYNPRGWLAKASSPLFSYSLSYEAPQDRMRSQYNGNISEQVWMTGTERTPYRYTYGYDRANRLSSGISEDGHGESLQYDKMGNITGLVRTGQPLIAGGAGTFAYSYGTHGNKLQSVDNGGNYSRSYQYDSHGNMVSDGQIKVGYNEVGLPKVIRDMSDVAQVSYLYDASGRKLSRTGLAGTRVYIDGIEYTGSGSGATIDLIHTAGGIARRSGSSYVHEYFLQDHLGNNRVVYTASGTVLQQTDYYPFGMEINRKVTSPKMRYTYNGKELQEEIGQYDYGARFYDPVIGRWNVVDPLAEQGRRWSPYVYGFNSPVRFIDPDGMWSIDAQGNMSTNYPEEIEAFLREMLGEEESGQDPPTKKKPNFFERTLIDGLQLFNMAGATLNKSQGRASDDFYDNVETSFHTFTLPLFILQGHRELSRSRGFTTSNRSQKDGAAKGGVQYTKSSLKLGQEMHKGYKAGLADGVTTFKEFTGIKGIRPDFVDFGTKTIYELKPFNPRQIQLGKKQLNNYKSIFEQNYGGTWKTVLDFY